MPDSAFRFLAESSRFILGHSYETVIVVNKIDGSEFSAGEHYGDPKVGLITPDESWFVTAGEGLQCFSIQRSLVTFFRRGRVPLGPEATEPAWFVHSARLESQHLVRVLIDPWSAFSSVWQVDLDTLSLSRLSNGPFLAESPHQTDVEY